MAQFAKINENNIVTEIHMLSEDVAITEEAGIDFLKQLLGSDTNWKQTWIDGRLHKNPANIGDTFDESRNAFITQQPHSSWVVNEDTCQWEAPTAMPSDGKEYIWNEDTKSWDLFTPQPADE